MWGQFGVPMARQLPSSCINCPRPPRGASGCDPALSQRACQLSADVGGLKAVAQAPAGPRMWRPGAGRMGRGRGKVAVGRAARRLPDSIWRTVFGEGEKAAGDVAGLPGHESQIHCSAGAQEGPQPWPETAAPDAAPGGTQGSVVWAQPAASRPAGVSAP